MYALIGSFQRTCYCQMRYETKKVKRHGIQEKGSSLKDTEKAELRDNEKEESQADTCVASPESHRLSGVQRIKDSRRRISKGEK